eukprot:363920-Chlamydomonas_euryale.AAC.2
MWRCFRRKVLAQINRSQSAGADQQGVYMELRVLGRRVARRGRCGGSRKRGEVGGRDQSAALSPPPVSPTLGGSGELGQGVGGFGGRCDRRVRARASRPWAHTLHTHLVAAEATLWARRLLTSVAVVVGAGTARVTKGRAAHRTSACTHASTHVPTHASTWGTGHWGLGRVNTSAVRSAHASTLGGLVLEIGSLSRRGGGRGDIHIDTLLERATPERQVGQAKSAAEPALPTSVQPPASEWLTALVLLVAHGRPH